MGYEYTITKEKNTFLWKVGYKEDLTIIEANRNNEEQLQNFMRAVSDSKVILSKLIISLSYILIVAGISFFIYKKNRDSLKGGGTIVGVSASIIALYIAVEASFDLYSVLQDVKNHYLSLIN
ncbi:hypothetical protein HLI_12450 [Halobacillus litoralis]|uniref:Uncharacterized protein n=2 Tax=Halobacillus litoralis TaxID=45668 RepID=A0A410ME57_9BACI|nr:hypothetical protein HLI_12450 [Halobacillus litoralis]